MPLSAADWAAISLSLQLATVTTCILLMLGTPLAWWLARTGSWLKGPVAAIGALPLVLPPTVLGFYLLRATSPTGPVGRLTESPAWERCLSHSGDWWWGPCATHCRSLCSHCRMRLQPSGNGHWRWPQPFGRMPGIGFSILFCRWRCPGLSLPVYWALRIRSGNLEWC